jgi:hypothetical protein
MRHIVVTLLVVCSSAFGQHAGGVGAAHGSAPGQGMHAGAPRGGVSHPFRGGAVVVPYPVYLGGYYSGYSGPVGGYGYDSSYAVYPPGSSYYGDPGSAYYGAPGYGDPSQQSPVMIVNPGFRPDAVNPVIRDYSNTPLPPSGMTRYDNPSQPYANTQSYVNAPPYSNQPPPPDAPPTIYLIAMKDHTIFPTVAYWVDGETLNYVTSEGVHNRASLALVDRDFSKQLNDERHVEFKLPATR